MRCESINGWCIPSARPLTVTGEEVIALYDKTTLSGDGGSALPVIAIGCYYENPKRVVLRNNEVVPPESLLGWQHMPDTATMHSLRLHRFAGRVLLKPNTKA